MAKLFYEGLPKVPADVSAELDTQISAEELHAALQNIKNGKAPGIDGLPADFYKVFWPEICCWSSETVLTKDSYL